MALRKTTFTIAYDSDQEDSPLRVNEIDIHELAQALQGLGSAVAAANRVLNGDQEIGVRVKSSFKPGSFGIPVEIIQLATSVDVVSAIGLSSAGGSFMLGGALEALKRLRNRKIDRLEATDDGRTTIHVENETFVCSDRVRDLIINPSFRSAIGKVFGSPAERGRASKIKIEFEGAAAPVVIERDDACDLLPSEEVFSKSVETDIYDAPIRFVSAHARNDRSWVVDMFGTHRTVDLLDEAFVNRINSPYGNISFGLTYRATIKETRTSRIGGRAKKTFAIIKVFDNEPQA